MKPARTVSNLLQAARALIEQGWCQGQYDDGDRYCVIGAIRQVRRSADPLAAIDEPAIHALAAALPSWCAPTRGGLVAFNDHPRTTRKRVLALFDRALIEVTK